MSGRLAADEEGHICAGLIGKGQASSSKGACRDMVYT